MATTKHIILLIYLSYLYKGMENKTIGVNFNHHVAHLTRWDAAEYSLKQEKGLFKIKAVIYFFIGRTVQPADVRNFVATQNKCKLVTKLIIRDINYDEIQDSE